MITKDKVRGIFCIIDEFDKNLNDELEKIYNYLAMTVMESAIVTAKADCRKTRLWPSLYAIISAHTDTLRSTISTVSADYSGRSFLLPFPTITSWNS